MNYKQISKKIAHQLLIPCEEDSFQFAVQLVIEKVTVPKEVESYSEEQLEKYIYNFLIKR